ncbi:MAG: hypothetical protein HZA58_10270 [Acidimicrobiia bacterium]|nr:hypothetical protein [Acidimicrobiia bacterium]
MTPEAEWLLLLDASLAHRLATRLRERGRNAVSSKELRIHGFLDPPLLRAIHLLFPLATIVTGDDHMPQEHGHLLARWGLTVAVIDPQRTWPYTQEQWKQDVLHRWAHKMQEQKRGTAFRYSVQAGGRPWVKPRNL